MDMDELLENEPLLKEKLIELNYEQLEEILIKQAKHNLNLKERIAKLEEEN